MERPYLKGIDRMREEGIQNPLLASIYAHSTFCVPAHKNYTHFNKYILGWEDGSALTILVEDLAT